MEELRVGGLGDCEAEDAMRAAVGEHEVGPFCQLGGVRGEVCLAGEEGGEGVLGWEAVRGRRGCHFESVVRGVDKEIGKGGLRMGA